MHLTHEGLSLWYGTPDAPAPGDDGLVPREGVSLVVGVKPANPINSLFVRYRVDEGMVHTVPGHELRNDYPRQIQYFLVSFPPFPTGDRVEYAVQLGCGGRQVPAPALAGRLPSGFHLAPRAAVTPAARRPAGASSAPVCDRQLRSVATVSLSFDPPQFVGETAAGVRMNFFVRDGSVVGKAFAGKVLEGTSDHLTVRRDGIGVIHILGNIVTDDGAVLDIASGGYVDLGPDGYRSALARNLPDRLPIVINPLFSTRHPRYRWLSRLQSVGVGYTHLAAAKASYSIYAVTPGISD